MEKGRIFLVEGEIIEKTGKKPFSKRVRANTVGFANEKAMCLFGSKNKAKRNKIIIKETREVKEDGTGKGSKGNRQADD